MSPGSRRRNTFPKLKQTAVVDMHKKKNQQSSSLGITFVTHVTLGIFGIFRENAGQSCQFVRGPKAETAGE